MGYSAEDIEARAEKLYTLYRTKRHHDSPALLIRNLHRDLGGSIYTVSVYDREMAITDYTRNPDTQQWENVRFETYLPYAGESELESGVIVSGLNRFRLARSIGHLFLHFLPDKSPAPQTVYRLGRSPEESEANHFAAALTMPRQAFTHHWHHITGGDLGKQSELFRTSVGKTQARAYQLGLIPYPPNKACNKQRPLHQTPAPTNKEPGLIEGLYCARWHLSAGVSERDTVQDNTPPGLLVV